MEFLVRAEIDVPASVSLDARQQLEAAEAARGRELIAQGVIRRIWRLPGRRANVAVYEASDATELHAALCSLPMWPYMRVRIEALARHPLEGQER